METESVTLASYQLTPHHLEITWSNGQQNKYHYFWLRENCTSENTTHKTTKQKLLEFRQINPEIYPQKIEIDQKYLTITWNTDHVSRYELAWIYKRPLQKLPIKTWLPKDAENFKVHQFEKIMGDDQAAYACLGDFLTYGIAKVTGAPQEKGHVVRLTERFGYIRDTNYGKTFEVRAVPQTSHLAYSPIGLAFHTDNLYRLSTPSIQVLHCIYSSAQGGLSTFADGYRIAYTLRDKFPEHFKTLLEVPVAFQYIDDQDHLYHEKPLLRVNYDGEVAEAFFNERVRAPLTIREEDQTRFYAAYDAYQNLIYDPSFEFSFKMEGGDITIFNNNRLFHGRTAYTDTENTHRLLEGCYSDIDGFFSRYRVLAKKYDKENTRIL